MRHFKEVCTGPEAFEATQALSAKDGEPYLFILWQPQGPCTVSCVEEEEDAVMASSVDVVVFQRVFLIKKSIWTQNVFRPSSSYCHSPESPNKKTFHFLSGQNENATRDGGKKSKRQTRHSGSFVFRCFFPDRSTLSRFVLAGPPVRVAVRTASIAVRDCEGVNK